jgi:hypothetical protein
MFGNAEFRLFLFTAQCFNTESMQKGYPNYRWDLIRYVKGELVTICPLRSVLTTLCMTQGPAGFELQSRPGIL